MLMSRMTPSWEPGPRPRPQDRLPYRWRLAAEWQFGAWLLLALVAVIRGEFAAAAVMVAVSAIFFVLLSGWREDRRINSPLFWWLLAAFTTALGFLFLLAFIFTASEG
jgi:hypothetical protein